VAGPPAQDLRAPSIPIVPGGYATPKRLKQRKPRRTGATFATWLSLGVAVPMTAFLLAAFAPTLAHVAVRPMKSISAQIAAIPTMASTTPGASTSDVSLTDTVGPLPQGSASLTNPGGAPAIQQFNNGPVPLTMIVGGTPGARRSPIREGVADFVRDAGATAGVNGTFFANASLNGTDNLLIGPSICDNETSLTNSPFDHKPQLPGRPMVLLSDQRTVIVPYQFGLTDNDVSLHAILPGMKAAFLGGVWLVHDGVAADMTTIDSFNVKDCMDPRRRAFFGVMADGRPMLGATTDVATSRQLARALQQAGAQEAVLLDSGFSTSLVFQDRILVTGHTSAGIPSRPVPQALLLYGQPDAASVQLADSLAAPEAAATAATFDDGSRPFRHHHHHIIS
jgi:hypothetical protein